MGQCYSVYLKMKLKDADEFVRLSRKYATDNDWSDEYMRKMSGVDGIIKQMISTGDLTVQCEDGWPVFRSDFDASYSWDGVMDEWFNAVAPALEDGSEIEVYPDVGSWKCVVRDGRVDKTYDEDEEDEEEEA